MDQEDMDYVMQFEDFWSKNDLSRLTDDALPPEFHDIVGNGIVTFGDKDTGAGPVGHFCANYDKAIRKGFAAIKQEAQEKIDGMKGRLYGDDAEREQFYYAVTIVCDAIITLAKRYAAECRRQAGGVRRRRPAGPSCSQMAEGLDWIMENPARTFLEAVQCLFLYQIVLSLDGNLHGLTFGRVDQYLGSFYEADLAAGTITRERAQEILDLFCLKVAEMNKIWPSLRHRGRRGLHLRSAHHRRRRQEGRHRRHQRGHLHAPRVRAPSHAARSAHVAAHPRGHARQAVGRRRRDHQGLRRRADLRERQGDHPRAAGPRAVPGIGPQLLPHRLRGAGRLRGRLAGQRRPRPGDVLADPRRRAAGHQQRREPHAPTSTACLSAGPALPPATSTT